MAEESGQSAEEGPSVRMHFEKGNALGPYAVICRRCGEVGHFHDPVSADAAVQAHRRKHRD